jgi:DNA-binding LacI/PurR family transcriptional regulator/DNA-binding transcriptional regulator YhcF (GntR family)
MSERITDDLRNRIIAGHYAVGTPLPSRRDLCREYEAAPLTVEQAIKNLVVSGMVRTEKGRGTFVAKLPATQATIGRMTIARSSAISIEQPVDIGILSSINFNDAKPTLAHDWQTSTMRGLEYAVTAAGGTTHFYNMFGRGAGPLEVIQGARALIAEGVTALACICIDGYGDTTALASEFGDTMPLIYVGSEPLPPPATSVYTDSQDAGDHAAQHLLQRGCESLLFISPYNTSWVADRLAGVRAAAARSGLAPARLRVEVAQQSIEEGVKAMPGGVGVWAHEELAASFAQKLFSDGLTLDACGVIAANDHCAIGFAGVALQRGFTAGRQYALIGFDDIPTARTRGLTTLRPPLEAMGQEAGRLLLAALSGQQVSSRVSMHSHLVARSTTRVKFGS